MTVERFVIQNFSDWEKAARKDGKTYFNLEHRQEFSKDIADGCFFSEAEILKAIGRYVSYQGVD